MLQGKLIRGERAKLPVDLVARSVAASIFADVSLPHRWISESRLFTDGGRVGVDRCFTAAHSDDS